MSDQPKYKFPTYFKYFFIVSNIVLTGFLIVVASPVICPLVAAMIASDTFVTSSTAFKKLITSFQHDILNWFNISLQDQLMPFNSCIKNFITHIVSYFPGTVSETASYFSISGLFIGGMLLGAMGVILAISILGIIKIIFD